ncbi:RsmB/NOP family class I SAM-dependent RNA methyltransferase [Paenibacillus sp. GCM10023248]|uniref:RsmB/NOP family class I SAM-dependent RNA methyltransferase n=1 Tax=unclassified Paenibacillus TaxID=185978 RepID=UPI002379F6CF|nr:RsmB/NOP family class I SAM-dependent RNA methyltransferase [Paenibacillus sp. MAHUQ-63]MDD9265646.1 RsmB/NOP family class I SAM-dependent RNA methyltransferase [Paenibacillus sp. MAHUQ-63]
MTKQLPPLFRDKMMDLLGPDEFEQFLDSYDEERSFGLRVNTGKIAKRDFLDKSPFVLEPVPWASEGYYYEAGERPGKHPYYHAGLYYIQEPSAMAPVELLQVRPGDKVLDLCAAPGGKSTQIAAKLQGEGVLVVNDNHSDRVKALVKNLELFGVRNAVVLNERPERMISAFSGYFDKILIDAPCSGEGMFRKEEEMMQGWERHTVQEFAAMQRELLGQAAQMLAPGGTIVYSTCTFSPEENEAQIAEFLDKHPAFDVVPVQGFSPGRPDWLRAPWCEASYSAKARAAVAGTARLWPHRLRGEGHYVAVVRKEGVEAGGEAPEAWSGAVKEASETWRAEARSGAVKETSETWRAEARGGSGRSGREALRGKGRAAAVEPRVSLEPLQAFEGELLRSDPFAALRLVCYGDHAYASPAGLPELHGLKVVRPGWYIGALHRGRFEPSHALAMGLRMHEAKRTLSLASSDERALRYLKGETLEVAESEIVRDSQETKAAKGYCLVCLDGHPVGWGKWLDGMLKNEYPPGWRWT